jgi:hypothetical protein
MVDLQKRYAEDPRQIWILVVHAVKLAPHFGLSFPADAKHGGFSAIEK